MIRPARIKTIKMSPAMVAASAMVVVLSLPDDSGGGESDLSGVSGVGDG